VEIKFDSNENIEWHYMQLELNWIELNFKLTKFNSNSTIRLKFNWKEMRCKLTIFIFFENMNTMLNLFIYLLKDIDPKRHLSMLFYLVMG
jgi:hypothetical protein